MTKDYINKNDIEYKELISAIRDRADWLNFTCPNCDDVVLLRKAANVIEELSNSKNKGCSRKQEAHDG